MSRMLRFSAWPALSGRALKTALALIICTLGVNMTQAQVNCEPSLAIECAANESVYCGDFEDFSPEAPTVDLVDCDDEDSPLSLTSSIALLSLGDCASVYTITWLAVYGDLSATCVHTVTVIDNVGPVFDMVPPSMEAECGGEIPEQATLTATDACSGSAEVVSFVSTNGGEGDNLIGSETNCVLTTPTGPGPDGSIWLNGVQALGLASSNFWSWVGSPALTSYPDGTAHVVGSVVNNSNPGQGWMVDMWFENRRNWDEWSGLGRSYKDDLNLATPGLLYEAWDYYELVPTFSQLVGTGSYAGNLLYLSHQPSNYHFGFQSGQAANTRNAAEGMSGWFYWEGWYNGQWRTGNGDLFTEQNCSETSFACEETTNYFWRAEDACGNNTLASQTITVVDTTPPVFDNCPADITIECGDAYPELPVVTATDACTDVVVTYFGQSEVSYDGPCYGTFTRTWFADDECENRAFCVQTITILDTTAPVFTFVPADATYECDEEIVFEMATASDICQGEIMVTVSEQTQEGDCPQEYTITRTFTADDGCGNSSTEDQIITVEDTTAPVFDPYTVYLAVECTELESFPVLTAQDNCSEVTVTLTSETVNSGGCLGVIQRIYTATDECGNSTEAFQFITILDTTPPVIENPADFTAECDNVPSFPEIEIYDNCGYDVEVETNTEILPGECENSYIIVWTWIATDYCENVSTASTSVTIVDTTDPYFTTFPLDEFYECDEAISAATFPEAADNCDEIVEVSVTEEVTPGECPQEYSIERIFRAFDNCGNQAMYVVYIYVSDTTDPVFEEQNSSFTYNCDEQVLVIEPAVSDNCGEVTLTYSDDNQIESYCYGWIYRTWTATDECDNSATFVQSILVLDITAPVITGTIEIDRPCDDYAGIYVSATDNCDTDVTITIIDEELVSGGCQGRILRTYQASDDCDNSETFVQIITLTDAIAPVLVEATEDFTVECDTEYEMPTAFFEDNCDNTLDYTTTSSEEMVGCALVITYTITATDNCDNSASTDVVVTIVDTTDPIVFAPQGGEFSCDEEIIYGMAEATDNCDLDLEMDFTDAVTSGECPQSFTVVREWTATDDCGNVGYGYTTYFVYDNTPPVLTVGESATIECDEEIPAPFWEATDNCGEVIGGVTEAINDLECGYEIVRTYTVQDECGNPASDTQTITVVDTTAPVIFGIIEIDRPCDNYAGIYVSVSDNCDTDVTITIIDEELVSGGCQGRILRTYQTSDDCGNSVTFLQIITLTDAIAPVLEEATEDFTVECNTEYAMPTASFEDNCDNTLDYITTSSEEMVGCALVITYTITATDNCGNSASTDVVVTIVDTTDPIVFAPQGGQFSCDDAIIYGMAEATDNCDLDLVIDFTDAVTAGECPQSFTVVREWTATDDCGNVGYGYSTYFVYDNIAPVFTSAPADEYYTCAPADWTPAAVSAIDNCGVATVSTNVTPNLDECGNGTITVSYVATDGCLNSSEPLTYVAYIQDNVDPVLSNLPADMEMECGQELPQVPVITASDNCDSSVEVEYESYTIGEGPSLEEGELAVCDLLTPHLGTNPCNYPVDWAMALFSMPQAYRWYQISGGELVQYADGTIHVTAQMHNAYDATSGFYVDVNFGNGMNWASWSTQSFLTSFKADCEGNGVNHPSWMYYLLQAGEGAELVGYGNYAGSMLNLVHAPSNNYFGFQLGNGANNVTGSDHGFGGWFTYSGTFLVNGDQIMSGNMAGAGDFAFDLDCCPDYTEVRCWTAVDCSGNLVQHCQNLVYGDGGVNTTPSAPVNPLAQTFDVAQKGDMEIVAVYPNPAVDQVDVKFVSNVVTKVSLDVIDMTGRLVGKIYTGDVEAGLVYKFTINTSEFGNGLYQVRLMSLTEVQTKQLSVIR